MFYIFFNLLFRIKYCVITYIKILIKIEKIVSNELCLQGEISVLLKMLKTFASVPPFIMYQTSF